MTDPSFDRTDPMLQELALAEGEEGGSALTLLVGGSWLEGTAIPEAEFRRLNDEAAGRKPPRGKRRAQEPDATSGFLHLRDVVIEGWNGPVRAPLLRVRLVDVVAWGPGRPTPP
jgi:hypothetical protein